MDENTFFELDAIEDDCDAEAEIGTACFTLGGVLTDVEVDDDDEDAFTVVATLSVTFFDAFCIERLKAASPAAFFADAEFTGLISGIGALSTLDSFEVPAPDATPVETHACESGCLCVAQNFIPHFCIREMNFSCC